MSTMKRLFDRFHGKRHLEHLGKKSKGQQPPRDTQAERHSQEKVKALQAELVAMREDLRRTINFLKGVEISVLRAAVEKKKGYAGDPLTFTIGEALKEVGITVETQPPLDFRSIASALNEYIPDECLLCGQAARKGRKVCRACERKPASRHRCKWCLKSLRLGETCDKHPEVPKTQLQALTETVVVKQMKNLVPPMSEAELTDMAESACGNSKPKHVRDTPSDEELIAKAEKYRAFSQHRTP